MTVDSEKPSHVFFPRKNEQWWTVHDLPGSGTGPWGGGDSAKTIGSSWKGCFSYKLMKPKPKALRHGGIDGSSGTKTHKISAIQQEPADLQGPQKVSKFEYPTKHNWTNTLMISHDRIHIAWGQPDLHSILEALHEIISHILSPSSNWHELTIARVKTCTPLARWRDFNADLSARTRSTK